MSDTGVQTCALPICQGREAPSAAREALTARGRAKATDRGHREPGSKPAVAPVQPQPRPYTMVPARRVPDARARRARARGWITIPPPTPSAEQLAVAHIPAVGWITTRPPLKVPGVV